MKNNISKEVYSKEYTESRNQFIALCKTFEQPDTFEEDVIIGSLYDFLKLNGIIPETSSSESIETNDICGVVRCQNHNETKFGFWTNANWDKLKFNSYEDYQEFSMSLVCLLSEARKKFEENKKEIRSEKKEEYYS